MEEKIIILLANIWRNDKTIYTYNGESRKNREGKENEESGVRWSTPREMVEDFANNPVYILPVQNAYTFLCSFIFSDLY